MPLINFSGLASGIDSEGLIEAVSDSTRAARVDPQEDKIADLEDENTALEEVNTKLLSVQSITRGFGTVGGGAIAKFAQSTDETVVTATASNAAAEGAYTLTVAQLAQNGLFSFASTNRTYTATSDAINPDINDLAAQADRTITIDVGTGSELKSITTVLTSTTTMSEMIDDLNDSFLDQGNIATATAVNVGSSSSPDYRILIVTNNEGTEKGSIAVSVGTEVETAGLPTGGAFDNNTTEQALDAQFTVNGISGTITRPSNTVTDLIPGVSFNLSTTGTATVSVATDVETSLSNVQEFIDEFNELVTFSRENSLVIREEEGEDVDNVFGPLARTSLDDNSIQNIRTAIIGSRLDSTNSAVRIFADFGVKTERDGTLSIDADEFTEALQANSTAVTQILENFGNEVGVTGGVIDQYVRFNGLIDITTTSNQEQVSDLNDRIARAEAFITKQADTMRQRFARLESTMARLQSQQQSLTAVLAGAAGG